MKRLVSVLLVVFILAAAGGGCSAGSKGDASYSYESTGSAGSIPSGSSQSGGNAPAGAGTGQQSAPSASPQAGSADNAGESGALWEPDSDGAVPLPILTPSNSRGKKYVYTVNLQIQTTAFMAGIRTLLNAVGAMEGYVERANVRGWDMHSPPFERNAEYTFRIYTERLADFLVVIEDSYNLVSLTQDSEDVTASYSHGSSTLGDLREQEARLQAALENTRLETEDRLALEVQLSQVQSSIRYHERQQMEYNDDILYSTIYVKLYEVIYPEAAEEAEEEEEEAEEPDLTFGERFGEAASRSWNGFVSFCQGFVIVIVRVAPTVIVLAVLAAIALLIYRAVRKYRKKRSSEEQANPGTQDDN